LSDLIILAGKHAWILYIDILILVGLATFSVNISGLKPFFFKECGGNLFDAVSMAVKAALHSTIIPKVMVTLVDGGEPELSVSFTIKYLA